MLRYVEIRGFEASCRDKRGVEIARCRNMRCAEISGVPR